MSVTSLSPGASAPSPKEVVESCRQAITCWNKPFSTKIGTQVEITSTDPQDGNVGYRESDWLLHWDGRRADQSGSTRFLGSRTAEKADYTARSVNLADGQRFYSAEQSEGPAEAAPRWAGITTAKSYDAILNDVKADPYLGALLFEYLNERDVASVLQDSQGLKMLAQERVNGHLCYVVEGDSALGTLRVWVAPDRANHPLKMVLTKTRNDHHVLRPELLMKDTSVKEVTIVMEWTEFREVEGTLYPVAAQSTDTMVGLDGTITTTRVSSRCKSLDLHPDFAALDAFTLNKLEGALLDDRDFPAISYTVAKGKLTPYVDKLVMNVIDREVERLRTEQSSPEIQAGKAQETASAGLEAETPRTAAAAGASAAKPVPAQVKIEGVSAPWILLGMMALAALVIVTVWALTPHGKNGTVISR